MKTLTKSILLLALLGGCSQDPLDNVRKTDSPPAKETGATVKPLAEQNPHDGIYVFDVEKYKQVQLEKNKTFKKMKPGDQELMMQIFKPFRIEVKGDKATASFAHDMIQGKLTSLSKSNNAARFRMTPVDESKRDQAVTLIFSGNNLVLDPGKRETDKMYFKRMN